MKLFTNKKMLVLILPVLLSFTSFKGYTFKTEIKPNSSFKIVMRIYTDSKVNYVGDSSFTERMNNAGVKLPMLINSYQAFGMSAKTDSLSKDSTIKMTSVFDYDSSLTIRNGDTVSSPRKSLAGLKIASVYSKDHEVKGVEVIGDNIPEGLKEQLAEIIGKMYKTIKYPDKPMEIGESFKQNMPTQIPISSNQSINMNIEVTYTLKSVDGNKAYFDTMTKMAVNDSLSSVIFKLNGEGTGKLVHDLERNYPIESRGEMNLNEKIITPEITTIISAKSKTYYSVIH